MPRFTVRLLAVPVCLVFAACGNDGVGNTGSNFVQPTGNDGGFNGGFNGGNNSDAGSSSGSSGASSSGGADAGASSGSSGSSSGGQDAGTAPKGPAKVIAKVKKDPHVAGDMAEVTCEAIDGDGIPYAVGKDEWSLSVGDPLKVVAASAGAGLAVVTTKAGTWPVKCELKSHSLVSDPAQVLYIAGAAARVTAVPDKPSIIAGDAGTAVDCKLTDSFGNATKTLKPAIGDPPPKPAVTTVSVPGDLQFLNDMVKGKKAGTYKITCSVDGAQLEQVPGEVTVKPGPPDFSKAVVKPSSAKVDVAIDVACTAYDEFGNVVDKQPASWQVDGGTGKCKASAKASGATLTCTKAGDHKVKCNAAGLNEAVASDLEITPGPVVSLKLILDPDLPNYSHGQKIQLKGEGADKYGNVNKDVPLKPITASPAGGTLDQVNAQVLFTKDGLYTVTAHAKENPAAKASRKVRVDTNGPLINITSPKRGATLLWTGSKLTVSFSVVDELSPVKEVKVNGVKSKAGVSVKHTVIAKAGMNVVKIEAKDQFDNTNQVVHAFYMARKYMKTESKYVSSALVSYGLDAFLGQKALDSGYRVHSKPKDLATVLEIVLKNFDLSPITKQKFKIDVTGYKGEMSFKKLTFGNPYINKGYPQIKLTATNSGLAMAGKIHNVVADVYLKGTAWYSPNMDVRVTASWMSVSGLIKVTVYSNGTTKVTTSNVAVKLHNLKVKIKNGWGFLVNWLISLFNGTITKALENQLKKQISTAIDGPLGKALQAFALNQKFNLPGFFGAPSVALTLTSKLQLLKSYGPYTGKVGGLRLGMRTALTSTRKVPYKILGSVARRSCLKTYQTYGALPRKSPFEIKMHMDLANQMMTALWQAGGLKVKVPSTALGGFDLSKFKVKNLDVKADFMLPPLINDCVSGGSPELQIGDIRLDVSALMDGAPVVLRAYISGAAKVKLVAVNGKNGKEIGLNLSPLHLIETDIDSVLMGKDPAPISTHAFFQQLMPVVAGQLVGMLKGTLASFPLPELDLSLLGSAIPKGTKIALDVQSVYSKPGNIHADGKVK